MVTRKKKTAPKQRQMGVRLSDELRHRISEDAKRRGWKLNMWFTRAAIAFLEATHE